MHVCAYLCLFVCMCVCFHPAFLFRCSLFFRHSHIILYYYLHTLCIFFFVVLNGTAPVSDTQCTYITATLIDRGYLTLSLFTVRGGAWPSLPMAGIRSMVRAKAVRGSCEVAGHKTRIYFCSNSCCRPIVCDLLTVREFFVVRQNEIQTGLKIKLYSSSRVEQTDKNICPKENQTYSQQEFNDLLPVCSAIAPVNYIFAAAEPLTVPVTTQQNETHLCLNHQQTPTFLPTTEKSNRFLNRSRKLLLLYTIAVTPFT
ncbi:hypothetical protein QTP88_014633 [Uroleucon formosanum]